MGREVNLCNVVATINGSNATVNRVIALLAHYDSRSLEGNDSTEYAPGANDNGSDVACLMEMTRLMDHRQKLGQKLKWYIFVFINTITWTRISTNHY